MYILPLNSSFHVTETKKVNFGMKKNIINTTVKLTVPATITSVVGYKNYLANIRCSPKLRRYESKVIKKKNNI